MKKLIKTFLTILLCFSLSSTYSFNLYKTPLSTANSYNSLANYNELYGIEREYNPQIALNHSTKESDTLKLKYLAVFIEFADSEDLVVNHLDDSQSIKNAETMLNSDELFQMSGPQGTVEVPSFKKYYEMQSYGKLIIETEIFPKENGQIISYKDSNREDYYKPYSSTNPIGYKNAEESLSRETELIDRAIEYVSNQIKDAGILPSEIDTGSDDIVDAISFFIEGRDPISAHVGWGDLLWSHKIDNYGLKSTILGKRVVAYNLLYTYDYTMTAGLFSLNRGTYGTIIHEFGHTLGLADLYRFDHSGSEPVGFYDVMGSSSGSNPQNLLTYFITEYDKDIKWHNSLPVITKSTQNLTIKKPTFTNPDEQRAIKIQPDKSSEEFFIIEYISKQKTYETHTPDSAGLIIYRVNELNKYRGNKEGGDHGELDHVFVFRPEEPSLGAGLGKLTEATLNLTRKTRGKSLRDASSTFDNETIYYSNGANSGIIVEVTDETADSITFDITIPSLEGSGTRVEPYLIKNVDEFLHFMRIDTNDKYYKLVNDLDFEGVEYPAIDFKGHLNGNGKTLKNITSSTGVFEDIGEYGIHSSIENLFVDNITVNSKTGSYLGGLASVASSVTIDNVHLLNGSVTNVESVNNPLNSTGGFIGNVSNSTVIMNSSSNLNVTAPKNVGGFIGLNMNAQIKNSFSTGSVNSTGNKGAFIALQCIMDTTFNEPIDAYYLVKENLTAVGGYAQLHNIDTLSVDELDKGMIGIVIPEKIVLLKNESKPFSPKTIPEKELNFTGSSENADTVNYENSKITGLIAGSTNLYTNITVGDHTIKFITKVTVRDEQAPITEEEVLNYFGLVKKENYVVGFPLGESLKNAKDLLSSFPGVTFSGLESTEGDEKPIATGMIFTLQFEGQEYIYTVVIKGDANGDGEIFATDYVKIKNQIMGKPSLEGAYYLAADIDNDGNIYAIDYVKIKNYIMGKGTIPQSW